MAVCFFTISLIACINSKTGKLRIDDKIYAVAIGEVKDYEDNTFSITLKLEEEFKQKLQETTASPFWLGTVSEGNFTSATGKTLFKDGIFFLISGSSKCDKILIYNTSDHSSFVEFDGITHQVLPPSYTAEEIDNLISSKNLDLCEKFDKYLPLDSEKNKAGISFETVSTQTVKNAFGFIKYSNEKVKSSQNYSNEFTRHFFAVDPEHPQKALTVELRGGHSPDNTEFFGILAFDGNIEAKYALVGFEGLDRNESAELETAPLFFVVELGDKYNDGSDTYRAIKSYCDTPYSAGDMFKGLDY